MRTPPAIPKRLLYAAIAALAAVLSVVVVSVAMATPPSTIYVRTDGSDANCDGTANVAYPGSGSALACAKQTVQAAINAASSGDTITVASGTYAEVVTINKSLTLDGAQAGVAGSSHNGAESTVTGFNVTNANVTIDGFDIVPGTSNSGTGIIANGGTSETVQNNIITGYESEGMAFSGTSGMVFQHNLVASPMLTTPAPPNGPAQDGIFASGVCDDTQILNNTFDHASSYPGTDIGLSCTSAANPVISDNVSTDGATLVTLFNSTGGRVTGNSFAGDPDLAASVIYIGGGDTNTTVSGNTVSGGYFGVALRNNYGDGPSAGTTITGNSLTNNYGGGISVSGTAISSSETVVAHQNHLSGNPVGVSNTSPGSVDATDNYWGTAVASTIASKISGSGATSYTPYYVDAGLTHLNTDVPAAVYVGGTYADGSAGGHSFGWDAFTTIQAGIDAVSTSGTVNVASGTYTENLTITKALSLLGPNANVDPNTGARVAEAVIDGGTGFTVKPEATDITINGFTVSAADTGEPIYNVGADAADVSGLAISYNIVGSGVRAVTVESNGDNVTITHNKLSGYTHDITFGDGTYNNLKINDNVLVDPTTQSYTVQMGPSGTGPINGFEFKNNTVHDTVNIGSNITNGTVSGNTFDAPVTSGLDLQIALHNSTVSGNTFEGSNANGCLQLFGSQYGLVPSDTVTVSANTFNNCSPYGVQLSPDVDHVDVTGNTFNNSYDGVDTRTATPWDLTGKDIHVTGNSILGSTHAGVYNANAGVLDATDNWFGSAFGPGALTGVNATPWYVDAAKTMLSNNADLASLSLSSGTLSPAFDPATTAYTTSVGHSVTSVTVTESTNPGANAVVTGGSSLSVGDNSVSIAVTSADGTATKTYTVTVTRATPPASTPSPPASTPPSPPPVTPASTPPPAAVNAPVSVAAASDQSGTVAVVFQPAPAGTGTPVSPVTVTTSWAPGTFTAPVTVLVAPQVPAPVPEGATPPPPTPVAGGFTVSGTTVQLTVTDASGARVTSFQAPLVIHVSASQAGDVPAYSQDGTSWTTIPQLGSPNLPEGQQDGYFRNADGSIEIYTRHATFFGLLKDVKAPTSPKLKIQVTKTGLRLSISGARDNVRVAGYVVSRNGRGYKATKRTYVVLPLRAGTYAVRARDAAGSASLPSKAIAVVRTASMTQPFKVREAVS